MIRYRSKEPKETLRQYNLDILLRIGVPMPIVKALERCDSVLYYEDGSLMIELTTDNYGVRLVERCVITLKIKDTTLYFISKGMLEADTLDIVRKRVIPSILRQYNRRMYKEVHDERDDLNIAEVIAYAKRRYRIESLIKEMSMYSKVIVGCSNRAYYTIGIGIFEGELITLVARKEQRLHVCLLGNVSGRLKDAAQDIGMNCVYTEEQSYWTVEAIVKNNTETAMIIGSIMFGTGVKWETEYPSMRMLELAQR